MYKPTDDLLEGIRDCWPVSRYPGDEYFYDMADVDILSRNSETMSAKSFFIRAAPFGGAYCLLGGITQALRDIRDLPLGDPSYREGLLDMGMGPELADYLRGNGRLRLRVWSPYEGSAFFPKEPVVTVEGPLPDVRLAEGILIQALNFPSLNLTDWERAVRAAYPGTLSDQSYRRAQDHRRASLYAMLAGCIGTSNCEFRASFKVPLMGTMGHEWIMSRGDPGTAFNEWLAFRPNKPLLLVDTGDTLRSDFPACLEAVWDNRDAVISADPPFWGPRNDSGNLAYLVVQEYKTFLEHRLASIEWFRDRMRFPLANDLDERVILTIKRQVLKEAEREGLDGADIVGRILWGIGTKKGSSVSQPTLGGVAKLMEVGSRACVKLALNAEGRPDLKTSIPGNDRSCFIRNREGIMKGVLVYMDREHEIRGGKLIERSSGKALEALEVVHPDYSTTRRTFTDYVAEPRQRLLYDTLGGNGFTEEWNHPTISSVQNHVRQEIRSLPDWVTDLENADPMKLSLTPGLFDLRQRMIGQGVIREDHLA